MSNQVKDMDRATLESLTLSQLQDEALRYQLTPADNRQELIDDILDHFERCGPKNVIEIHTERAQQQSPRTPRVVHSPPCSSARTAAVASNDSTNLVPVLASMVDQL